MKRYLCKGDKVKHETTSRALPRGGDFFFLESEVKLKNPIISIDEDGNNILIEDPAKEIEAQVKVKYDEMVSDVYTNMHLIFGTNNDISASAFAATWEAMIKRPENYVDSELGFGSSEEVVAYAQSKINDADSYGVFRMKRIAQFQLEKSVILNAPQNAE